MKKLVLNAVQLATLWTLIDTCPAAPLEESAPAPAIAFTPPSEEKLADDEYGRAVKLGKNIFTHTGRYAAQYVGNQLSCSNCHLDAGRRPDSAPIWAAYGLYPAYRTKTKRMDTYAMRIQECFEYSMNGHAPPADSPELVALETYSQWLATGAPIGVRLNGQGYRKLEPPRLAPDFERGRAVFQEKCASCHGSEGEGRRNGEDTIFPALWGKQSYNWGAGMAKLSNAAAFIRSNMPFGNGGSLTSQEAWDLAMFVNGHERPQDPRFVHSVEETRVRFHNTPDSLYGAVIEGHLLGSGLN